MINGHFIPLDNMFQVYFESDEAFMILIALFSISSGYIGNIVMMFGPKMMDHPVDQGRAASILVFYSYITLYFFAHTLTLCQLGTAGSGANEWIMIVWKL